MIGLGPPARLPSISGVELLEELGRGGMGVVYLGRQPKLDRPVAVKVLRPWTGVDGELVERFLREARAAALTDAAIVPLHDVGVADDTHYLVMAYMPGGSLREVIKSRRLAPAEVVMVGLRIAGALATAHAAGVLHRDVKPSNILLDARGNPFLSDFGIAQLAGLSRLTGSGASPGTAEYMAPELATGADPSESADIYSLGATLYECATGQPPFTGANHLAVVYRHSHDPVPPLPEEVPEPLTQAIMRSLAKQPEERFPDAAALETALAEVPAEPVVVARESVPSLSAAQPHRSTPLAPDDLRPTLSVAGRRPVDAAPKRPGRLGRLRGAVPARVLALGAAGMMAMLVLATVGAVVLPRVTHPTAALRPTPIPHPVTATARPTPEPTPAASATATLAPAPPPAATAAAPRPVGGTAAVAPGPRVQGWSSLGSGLTSAPAVSSWASNRMDVFGRGSDGSLWHRWWSGGTWSRWESLGGYIHPGSAPAAVSWAPNRIDVFVWGGDNQLWHKWWDGQWEVWEALGGALTSSPAVSSWSAGRLDVLVRGTDGAIWHIWWQGGWAGWASLGGDATSAPAAASWGPNRIDAFVRGTDNGLWHLSWDGANWGWGGFGGGLTSAPAVASWGPNRLDLVALRSGGTPYHKSWAAGWSGWSSLGGVGVTDPAIVDTSTGTIFAFVQGTDGALWYTPVPP